LSLGNEPVDQTTQLSWRGPPRDHVAADLVDGDHGATAVVMTGHDASDLEGHVATMV